MATKDDLARHAAPQIWMAVLLAAVADFLIVDVLGVVHRMALPEGLTFLPGWQARWAPVVANATLVAAALLAALLLPGLVRLRARDRRRRLTAEVLVILGLLILGLNVIRVVRSWPWLVSTLNLLLIAVHATALVRLVALRPAGRTAWIGAALLAALPFPHLHRLALEWAARDAGEAGWVAAARVTGDAVVVLALAATALLPGVSRRPRPVEVAAGVAAAAFLLPWLFLYAETHDVVTQATGLWLTALPPAALVILVPAAAYGVGRQVAGALLRDEHAGIAAGLSLWLLAGFLPIRPENSLLAYAGTLVFLAAMEGRAERRVDVARLLF